MLANELIYFVDYCTSQQDNIPSGIRKLAQKLIRSTII